MSKMTYNDALKEALNQPPIDNCGMTNQELESAIEDITEQLKGYLPNAERLMLVADRSEFRATLKQRLRASASAKLTEAERKELGL